MSKPLLLATAITASLTMAASAAAGKNLGYTDTPLIPGTQWHVHDGNRPQPPIVTPGEPSTAEKAGTAPSDAVVLFDGKDLSKWKSGKEDAKWVVRDGFFECVPKAGYLQTRDSFGPDVQLHIEWAAPTPPQGSSQGRGNSGVFFYGGTYEIQVLDNYDNPTYPDGQASALYGQWPPLVNASRKPGEWQTYDIIFEAPRWKDGKLESPAYATVFHNGVLTQLRRPLFGGTTHRKINEYRDHGPKGPIALQDHGNPVRFRNVWIRELNLTQPAGPEGAPAAEAKPAAGQ
jgi:hypothetical protein